MSTLSAVQTRIKSVAAAFAVVGAMAPVGASALTLDTTWLQANSLFVLSESAFDLMNATKTSISAAGNATFGTSSVASDGSLIPTYNLPVTKVDVSLGIPLFGGQLVTPNSGNASGSALIVSRGSNQITLANFVIDFSKSLVMADITANGVTSKNSSLYSFNATNLDIGLAGLSLTMKQELNNLTFTPSAAATFSSGLKLPSVFSSVISTLNFGKIKVDINTYLRLPAVNATPYVAAAVPEAPSVIAMALGLVGIAAVTRRQRKV